MLKFIAAAIICVGLYGTAQAQQSVPTMNRDEAAEMLKAAIAATRNSSDPQVKATAIILMTTRGALLTDRTPVLLEQVMPFAEAELKRIDAAKTH